MKRRLRGTLIFACILWIAPPLAGQAPSINVSEGPSISLSLESALELALSSSLSLAKTVIDLGSAGIAVENIWSLLFPGIGLSAAAGYQSPSLLPGGESGGFGYGLSLSLSLTLNFSLLERAELIRLAYSTELLNYENSRRLLEIQTAKSFYTLLAWREYIIILEEALFLAEGQLERDEGAFAAGFLGQFALMQSRLGLENARYSLSAARTAYASLLGEFLMLLGLELPFEEAPNRVILEGDLELARLELDPEQLIRDYLPRRPDILAQAGTIRRLELERKARALELRSPTLTITGGYGLSGYTGTGRFADSFRLGLGLSVPISPWIPGSAGDQAIGRADREIEQARLDLQNMENSAKILVRSLAERIKLSWEGIGIARSRAELAARNYDLAEQGARNGSLESPALETARNGLVQARQQLVENELAYKTLSLDLAAALNIHWTELSGASS
ncbi:MAG: TolC family protein [Treponema sp.]|jgi:outer membrane protein TolC|nr:TolC family protein [Treponema sp.]